MRKLRTPCNTHLRCLEYLADSDSETLKTGFLATRPKYTGLLSVARDHVLAYKDSLVSSNFLTFLSKSTSDPIHDHVHCTLRVGKVNGLIRLTGKANAGCGNSEWSYKADRQNEC